MKLIYHLVNVFTRDGQRLSGNPLCVFEDGSSLDGEAMQALARQFNLSETTFLLPSTKADVRVRIFTPDFEMPFAGHPTLGSAHVLRMLRSGDFVNLEMLAGNIPVRAQDNLWTLTANAPVHREIDLSRAKLAAALGLESVDLLWQQDAARPLWLNTGSDQLIVPLRDVEAVRRTAPRADLLTDLKSAQGRQLAYVFASAADGKIVSRFLFEAGGAFREDPATGSACANLGGWYLATGAALPLRREIWQGDQIHRPSTLRLSINATRQIQVAGEVCHLGRGELEL